MTSKLHSYIFQRCVFTKKEKHVNGIPMQVMNTFDEITKSQQLFLVFISWG